MKAIIWTKYGSPDGLQLREVDQPTPNEREILIKNHAATVSTADTEFRRLKLPFLYSLPLRFYLGLTRPSRITILGTEFAGEVVSIGKDVTRFQAGDKIFGYTGLKMGTYAEYLCLPEEHIGLAGVMAKMPVNANYEEAAPAVFGGIEALHALRQAKIQPGQKVLIAGAGGSIGTCAVQLAKHYGGIVTGVDHTVKLEMLRSIGADHVIDYTQEDFTKSGQTYDVIFDTIGKSSFSGSMRSLNNNGTYLNANPGLFGSLRRSAVKGNKKIILWSAGYSTGNLLAVRDLIEAGTIKAVIDRRYPLEQVAEAHRYVDTGLKKGNVVVNVISPGF